MEYDFDAVPEQQVINKVVRWALHKLATSGNEGEVQRMTDGRLAAVDSIWTDVLTDLTYNALGRLLRTHIDSSADLTTALFANDDTAMRKALHAQEATDQLFPAYLEAIRRDYPAMVGLADKWFEQAYEFITDLWIDNQTIDATPHNNPDGTYCG